MSLIAEYPFIFKICQSLDQQDDHDQKIKVLNTVLIRHSHRFLTQNNASHLDQHELRIFLLILQHFLDTAMASNTNHTSTIAHNQSFHDSLLYRYTQMTQSILNNTLLAAHIDDDTRLTFALTIARIYYDYAQFKDCEAIIKPALVWAKHAQHWSHFIELMVMRCEYVCFAAKDNGNSNSEHDELQRIDNEIHCALPLLPLPKLYGVFLKCMQVALRMKKDESQHAAHLLMECVQDLLAVVREYDTQPSPPSPPQANGKKRKLSAHAMDTLHTQPRKKQKLNNSNANNLLDEADDAVEMIRDADICCLINFCALLALQWIARNSSFDAQFVRRLQTSLAFLKPDDDVEVDTAHMNEFERTLMKLFAAHDSHKTDGDENAHLQAGVTQNIEQLSAQINGEFFTAKLVPLLQRTDPDYHTRAMNCNLSHAQTSLCRYFRMLAITDLSAVIKLLFETLRLMHSGAMRDAAHKLQEIETKLDNFQNTATTATDFHVLNLRFFVWSLSMHLQLMQADNIQQNILHICRMIHCHDSIVAALHEQYCKPALFANHCRCQKVDQKQNNADKKVGALDESSSMHTFDGHALIFFDETERDLAPKSLQILNTKHLSLLQSATTKSHEKFFQFLEEFVKKIQTRQLLSSMPDCKIFLKNVSKRLHLLSSTIALMNKDRKWSRNQSKRAHRLTVKTYDYALRHYIRLMLEFLKADIASSSKANIQTEAQRKKLLLTEIFKYLSTLVTVTKSSKNIAYILPFAALCAIFVYCTVDDRYLNEFRVSKKRTQKTVESQPENMDKIELTRKISFLKFMLFQVLRFNMHVGLIPIVCVVLVFLYGLMAKCSEYQAQAEKLKDFLSTFLPKQRQFMEQQFSNCAPIKNAMNRVFSQFLQDNKTNIVAETKHKRDADAVDANTFKSIKACVAEFHDFIYVGKSN